VARWNAVEFEVAKLGELLAGATWTGAGIGRHPFEVAHRAPELGGYCRTAREDNILLDRNTILLDRNTLAPRSAALVARVATMAQASGRQGASAKQALQLLGLRLQ
jgi:uncharacterized protein (DUF849 family)